MDHRTPRALAAAAALALSLGACSDIPTTAPARIPSAGQPAHTASALGATLIPNTVKYRDNGGKPATGRSGSAALRALALKNKNGVTELEFGPVSASSGEWAVSGTMSHAHIKALTTDSAVMFVRNLNNIDATRQRLQFSTLMRGQYLRVQANVTGIDPHRTDVVTVTERVKLRPDVAVRLGQMAPEVPASQPVPIYATVTELNGDVGARLDCMLLVDGVVADQALGVWVDAGDAVTCAFAQSLAPGTHTLQVEVRDPVPADWDDANNSTPLVQVVAVGNLADLGKFAVASAGVYREVYRDSVKWHYIDAGIFSVDVVEYGQTQESEFSHIEGALGRGILGPISLSISQSSGGRLIHSAAWTAELTPESPCIGRSIGDGTNFSLCSWDIGDGDVTWFTYDRPASSVTYHSRLFRRKWDDVTGEDLYYYHENEVIVDGSGPFLRFRDDYSFRVRLTTGDEVLTAASDLVLEHVVTRWGGWGCDEPGYNPVMNATWEHCELRESVLDEWVGVEGTSIF